MAGPVSPCGLKACFYLRRISSRNAAVTVLNISASGIGVLADHEIATGTLLNVEMQGSTGQEPPLSMLACVVHVNAQDGQWALGCNFIARK